MSELINLVWYYLSQLCSCRGWQIGNTRTSVNLIKSEPSINIGHDVIKDHGGPDCLLGICRCAHLMSSRSEYTLSPCHFTSFFFLLHHSLHRTSWSWFNKRQSRERKQSAKHAGKENEKLLFTQDHPITMQFLGVSYEIETRKQKLKKGNPDITIQLSSSRVLAARFRHCYNRQFGTCL